MLKGLIFVLKPNPTNLSFLESWSFNSDKQNLVSNVWINIKGNHCSHCLVTEQNPFYTHVHSICF